MVEGEGKRAVRRMIKEEEKIGEETEKIMTKLTIEAEKRRKIGEGLRKRKKAKGIPECLWTNAGKVEPVVWKRIAGKMTIVSAS